MSRPLYPHELSEVCDHFCKWPEIWNDAIGSLEDRICSLCPIDRSGRDDNDNSVDHTET